MDKGAPRLFEDGRVTVAGAVKFVYVIKLGPC